jgi:alkylation response protein AidB-like acyl-CoA dehydrogenase
MTLEAAPPPVPVEDIAAFAAEVDETGRFPTESVEALRRDGLLGLGVGPDHGGPGGGPVEVVQAIEQVARACASTGMVYAMHVAAAQTLIAGTSDGGVKAQTVRRIAAGEHVSTLAYSEKGSRSHFWAQVSRAVPDDGGIRFDADKSWATSAGHVDSYVTAVGAPGAEDPMATELYLVDADTPGIEIRSPFNGLGMRGNASAPLSFRSVRVDADRRLGEPASGFRLMMTATLPWFVLCSAACSVGIAAAALASVAGHAVRARFEHLGGTRLADLPTVRARMADAKVRHMAARALLLEVAGQVAAGAPQAPLGVMALKAFAAEAAIEVTDAAMRVGGGAAFSKHLPLERHFRDARAASVMAPTTDALLDLIGKTMTGQELF